MTGSKQYIYDFENGDGKNKMLLGGKGANLCEMTQIGLNVPPGFTITTDACNAYLERNQLPAGLMESVKTHMQALEKKTGKELGSSKNPLLVSVRSGSSMSMPGMMDTILNLGLNETSLQGLIKQTGNETLCRPYLSPLHPAVRQDRTRHQRRTFRRKHDRDQAQIRRTAGSGSERRPSQRAGEGVPRHRGTSLRKPFPQDPYEQLEIAIGAVFGSWMGKRAVDYRRQFRITRDQASGTAVNICTMVFGNMGNDSGTGVGFTRNPVFNSSINNR